jgi:hypothetical protein
MAEIDQIILCVTPSGCTCGAPADTPSGMHHDHCRVNPAKPDGRGCRVCKTPPTCTHDTWVPEGDEDGTLGWVCTTCGAGVSTASRPEVTR